MANEIKQLELENQRLRVEVSRLKRLLTSSADSVMGELFDAHRHLDQTSRDVGSIIGHIPGLIAYWDRNLINRFGNQGYADWFGISADSMPGMHVRDVIGEENYRRNRPFIEAALRGEKQQFERNIPTPAGEQARDIMVQYIPDIVDEQVQGLYTMVTDITSLKQTEGALVESESRFRQIFEANGTIFLLIEPVSGAIVDANNAAADFYGYGVDQLRSMRIDQLNALAPSEVAAERASAMRQERNYFIFPNRLASGELRTVEVRSTPIRVNEQLMLFSIISDVSEHHRTRLALERSEKLLRDAQQAARIGSYINNLEAGTFEATSTLDEIFGITEDYPHTHEGWVNFMHPDFMQSMHDSLLDSINNKKSFDAEYKIIRPSDGVERWMHGLGEIAFDNTGKAVSLTGTVQDITDRKQVETTLKASEERFRLMFDRAMDGIVILSDSGKVLAVNEAFARMHGYTPDEMAKLHLRDLDTPETAQGLPEKLARVLAGESLSFEVTHYHKDGRVLLLEVSSSLITANGERLIQAFHRDITERRRTDELVRELAYYDPLTGLANRMLLKDRLIHSMLAGQRSGNFGALLFLDLDNFKPLNDQHGHGVGDMLLAEVAKRLRNCVRQIDTVARFGGDEFIVLLDDLAGDKAQAHSQADQVAEKVRSLLADPYEMVFTNQDGTTVQHVQHRGSASIGVTLFLGQDSTQDDVLIAADLAMYRAKDMGGNTVCFFDAQMQLANTAKAILRNDLHNGILEKQFSVHYQAQLLGVDKITGVEALLRWRHPTRGWVTPAEFIATAEKTGLILPLGLGVLETACTQLSLWSRRRETAHLTMAINVSARQFHHSDFVDQVLAVLERTGANPNLLKLELTESVLITDVEGVIVKMNLLNAAGISFSLDDFGTGYSSLVYLKRLPLSKIKVAQEFVRDILTDPDVLAIVRMALVLADSMGLEAIAEGVETESQRKVLAGMGCHRYQGYLFSPALPVQEFEALLARVPT